MASMRRDRWRAVRKPRTVANTLFFTASNTGMKDLGTLGGDNSLASRVNDRGQVVGCSTLAGNAAEHAFVYSSEAGMKDLGTLGGPNSFASNINNSGQVVGGAEGVAGGAAHIHAFLYSGGKMIDLNSLVDPSSGWTLGVATAINDLGQIAGVGTAPDGWTRVPANPYCGAGVPPARDGNRRDICTTTRSRKEGIAMT